MMQNAVEFWRASWTCLHVTSHALQNKLHFPHCAETVSWSDNDEHATHWRKFCQHDYKQLCLQSSSCFPLNCLIFQTLSGRSRDRIPMRWIFFFNSVVCWDPRTGLKLPINRFSSGTTQAVPLAFRATSPRHLHHFLTAKFCESNFNRQIPG
jgi:hypothetical protein